MFIVWPFVHNSIRCNDKSQNGIGLATFVTKQIQRILCFQNVMTCHLHPTDKCLFKVKNRNTTLLYWLWSKSTIKTPERCHVVFSFNFEHIQQINLIFSLLTLNMYLSVGHRIKFTKQLKCTLNNRAVSLKHVHVAWVSQHGLNKYCTHDHSDWTLVRRRLNWLKMFWGSGAGGRITQTSHFLDSQTLSEYISTIVLDENEKLSINEVLEVLITVRTFSSTSSFDTQSL